MEICETQHDEYLGNARALVEKLEAGNIEDANVALDGLTKLHEMKLFQDVGKLTRQLHDTITNFQIDSKLSALAESEIPDAKERLTYVISLTEKAADRTLTVVEDTLPRAEQLDQRATQLKKQWDRFRNRDMAVEEFRGLSNELDEFLDWTSDNASRIHQGLSEVMMAQDFQDLTGQVICRVINLVQEVEDSLVDLIKITGKSMKMPQHESEDVRIRAEGPRVPLLDSKVEVVSGQDDVDDLLSSLGF